MCRNCSEKTTDKINSSQFLVEEIEAPKGEMTPPRTPVSQGQFWIFSGTKSWRSVLGNFSITFLL